MKTSRILMLNWRCPTNPSSGGAEKVTMEYAKELVSQGYNVVWLSGKYNNAPEYEIINGVEVYRSGNFITIHFIAPFLYWIKFKAQFDIVIDQIHGIPFLTPFWAFKSKKFAFIHEVAQEIWDEMFPFPLNLVGKIYEKIYFWFYKSTRFLTVSDSTKKDLITFGIPEKSITMISNGLSIDPITTSPVKEKHLTILFGARLVKMKGIEDTMKSFSDILNQVPNSQLWVFGSGTSEYEQYLKNYAQELKIQDNITFYGHVTEAKKIELYQKAHFLIHTSVREGFGLVVLEANSQGTPAIVYDSPGLRDVVKNNINGFIVEKENTKALAEKIIEIYKNEQNYSDLSYSSIKYTHDFTWDASKKKFMNFIKQN